MTGNKRHHDLKMMKAYYVYIMSNRPDGTLYTGVTNSLKKRVKEHREARDPAAFTARYDLERLVYFEKFEDVNNAIRREKQIKAGSREKKIELIESKNLSRRDLSPQLGL